MQRLYVRVAVLTLLVLILVCVGVPAGFLIAEKRRLGVAERGAQAALDGLPTLAQFTIAAVRDESFHSEEGDGSCYYGRKWFLVGTSLPESEALGQYTDALYGQGWRYENTELSRGLHEEVYLDVDGPPGFIWDNGEDPTYRQAAQMYPTLLHGSLDYELPSRTEC